MTPFSKSELKILTDAASQDGTVTFPVNMKPVTRERILGKFTTAKLLTLSGDGGAQRLTGAGYRAAGRRPPAGVDARALPKKQMVLDLLRREEGASLGELIAATGWQPHTTRAVLSRLRSAGEPLLRSRRDDDVSAYRIVSATPAPKRARKRVVADQAAA